MKYARLRFISITLSCVLILSGLPSLSVQAAEEIRSAAIYSFTGEVSVRRGGDREFQAFEGMRLEEGDTIITASGSTAEIALDSDKTIEVAENTEITLDELSGSAQASKTSASVFMGTIFNEIREKLSSGSSYETKTPNAVLGVRGTQYVVNQKPESTSILVCEGIVYQEAADAEGFEATDITAGNALSMTGGSSDHIPQPINVGMLSGLPQSAVEKILTDELFSSLTDLSPDIKTKEEFISYIQKNNKEAQEKSKNKIEEKLSSIEKLQDSQPDAFFTDSDTALQGQNNSLLLGASSGEKSTGQTTGQNNTDSSQTPAQASSSEDSSTPQEQLPAAKASDSGSSGRSADTNNDSGTKPEDSGDNTGGGDNGNIGGDTGGDTGGGGGNTDGDTGGDTGGGGGNTGGDTGGDGGNTGGDTGGGDSNITPPTPEKPQVSVGSLLLDAVYDNQPALISLAVTWTANAQASGYQYELKGSDGAYYPFTASHSVLQKGGQMRILIPAAEQGSLQGQTLRIMPQTSSDKVGVGSEVVLDFTKAASQTVYKLGRPDGAQITLTYGDAEKSVRFTGVNGTENYRLKVYQDDQPIVDTTVSAPGGNGLHPLNDGLTGSVYATLQALGDGFDTFDSETGTSSTLQIQPPQPPQLGAPGASGTYNNEVNPPSCLITWAPIANATGYTLEFSDGSSSYEVSASVNVDPAVQLCSYGLTEEDMAHTTSVKIRALGDGTNYSNSEWSTVTLH